MSYQATLSSGTSIRQSSLGRAAEVLGAPIARLAQQARLLSAAWRGRAAVSAMADMSSAELRDIGLLPDDLRGMRHLPYGADPTEILARVAADRTQSDLRI